MKMRVLLVDDEPFILQGLTVLIDWNAENCEIVKTAANGQEALDYIRSNPVDIIIADIKMPIMTGLELLEKMREENISDAYFIILSGYNDFQYAQAAIHYSCMDYILKPVQKDNLLEIVRRVAQKKTLTEQEEEEEKELLRAALVQNLTVLMRGMRGKEHLAYVKEHLKLSERMRYIHISLDNIALLEELSDEEMSALREKLFLNCTNFLAEDADHCIKDMLGFEEEYEIGFVYCDYMEQERGMDISQFLNQLLQVAAAGIEVPNAGIEVPVVLLVGKCVDSISKISQSYSTACALRSFHGFQGKKDIYYYEEEIQVSESKVSLCKPTIDRLVMAVEHNDRSEINKSVDELYGEMELGGMKKEVVTMNTNYLLFQLIHLAVEQDETVNQEEVMLYISENVSDSGIARGDRAHMRRFASEYADYLIQLRKNVSRGVLVDIEKEIKEHFAENLTLRELSKKYYVNSSYLGQIFRKKYGQSFKDYLSNYRINEAAQMLLKTDEKIFQIAESVGYHDTDYFISKFIEQKGCTPARYRKNSR